MRADIFELPFNGVKAPQLLRPNPAELLKYVINGWLLTKSAEDKRTLAPRAYLRDFIIIMSKPDWKTVFCHYACIAANNTKPRKTLIATMRRAFLTDGIEEDLSEIIADLAVS